MKDYIIRSILRELAIIKSDVECIDNDEGSALSWRAKDYLENISESVAIIKELIYSESYKKGDGTSINL